MIGPSWRTDWERSRHSPTVASPGPAAEPSDPAHGVTEPEGPTTKKRGNAMQRGPATRLLGLILSAIVLAPLLVAVSAASFAPVATAAPEPLTTSSQGATLGYSQLGLSQSYTFAGNGSSVGLKVPVPRALHPTMLIGTITIPPNFGAGNLVAESGTTIVSSFPLPNSTSQYQQVPFFENIATAPVAGPLCRVQPRPSTGWRHGNRGTVDQLRKLPASERLKSVGDVFRAVGATELHQ